jgi:hypothetical protein
MSRVPVVGWAFELLKPESWSRGEPFRSTARVWEVVRPRRLMVAALFGAGFEERDKSIETSYL